MFETTHAGVNLGEAPSYLVAGHTTRDLVENGWRIGGSVAYAVLVSRHLGLEAFVVSSCGSDVGAPSLYHTVNASIQGSQETTTFRNLETEGRRTQEILAVADPLTTLTVPAGWKNPNILHLAPVFQELDETFVRWFSPRLCGATLQGWLRAADDAGRVKFGLHRDLERIVQCLDIAIFSWHDLITDIKLRESLFRMVPVCVETHGAGGCVVAEKGRERAVTSQPLAIEDSTGAGDVFATAFLARYFESGDPMEAARFANEFAAGMLLDPDFRKDLSV
ncbi:MAG TPA: PfkB family carbohydrate kinase [Rhodothermales bacterium]|nr:PfkB family carbohydrate kinase [Rhodothermales bacterium]